MDERSEQLQRRLDPPLLIAALLTIPVIVLEGASVGEPWKTIGAVLNWATWLVFLAAAVAMLAVVPDRRRWIAQNPIDVAIIVLTPPFLTALAPVRLLRLLRPLRLLRLAPIARRLFTLEGVRYMAILALVTLVAGGAAFAAVENKTTLDGMYWALATMTTVGYGDLRPETAEGKGLAAVVMLVGIGFVAVLTGAIAQRFLSPELEEEAEEVEVELDATTDAILRELRDMRARLVALEDALMRRR